MEIVEVAAYEFRRPLDGRHCTPTTRWSERRLPLLRIATRNGLTGIGEGWCEQDDIDGFFHHLHRAVPLLLGADPRLIERAWQSLWELPGRDVPEWAPPAVASAVDLALWDLLGRSLDVPVYELLGARRDLVPVYASGGLYVDGEGPDELAAEMRSHVAHGFQAVKLKVGLLPRDDDIARVAVVRAALGPDVEIVVDAGEQLTVSAATGWVRRLAELGVAAIEAPLPASDVAGMMTLMRGGRLPVMAGAREWRVERFREWLRMGAVGVLQFNPGLCGGITGALRAIALDDAHGVPASPQNHGSAVLLATCLHLGAARGAVAGVEVHRFHDHLHDALPAPMRELRDGGLSPDGPGLGLPERLLSGRREVRLVWRERSDRGGE